MLQLAKVFADGMILQQRKRVSVFGWTDAGKKVFVEIQGKKVEATADRQGSFLVWLDPLEASHQETLTVSDGEETICINDVAVGEVFIAGGQSNMEFPLRYEKFHEEAYQTRDTDLRFFDMPKKYYDAQDEDFDYSAVGVWRKADSEENLGWFSAVAFYFAKEIRRQLDVPVGIIGCNWGGTRSCAWMKEESVREVGPQWQEEWERSIEGKDMDAFWATRKSDPQADAGRPGMGEFDKVIMPRTPSMEEVGKGMMVMAQQGFKDMMEKNPEALKEMTEKMGIDPTDMKGENVMQYIQKVMEIYQKDVIDARIKPGILYDQMVCRIAPYSAAGVLWYQGESDDVAGLQRLYGDMFGRMVDDWRQIWQDESLPFIEVQLPGWQDWMTQGNLDYATIRKGQEDAAKNTEGVYMASISDVGEQHDIHPKDKKTVGKRMSLLARHYIYGEDLLCEAPRPEMVKREGNRIIITMKYAGNGLKINGENLTGMEILEGDKKVSYEAKTDGADLILTMEDAPEGSVLLRFARDAWYLVNLVNEAEIPAIPFEARC